MNFKQYEFWVYAEAETNIIVYENEEKGEKHTIESLNKAGFFVVAAFTVDTHNFRDKCIAICEMRY